MSKNSKNLSYEDYEEYEGNYSFEKLRQSKKKKMKGHQTRHPKAEVEVLAELFEQEDFDCPEEPKYINKSKFSLENNKELVTPTGSRTVLENSSLESLQEKRGNNGKKTFEFGPNTHELVGNKIDYDRVANMEMIQSDYKGKITFGIKFTFKGKNANTRTVWYNQRQRERDQVFAQEYKFWLSIGK